MSDPTPMQTLVQLAEQEAEKQARRMGAAQQAHQENTLKLEQLLSYRQDYEVRYQQGMQNGLGMSYHQNYREFMLRLDEAISGQQGLVNLTESRLQTEHHAWQEAERKRLSFKTLADREQTTQMQQEQRREQKASDEHATRMASRQIRLNQEN